MRTRHLSIAALIVLLIFSMSISFAQDEGEQFTNSTNLIGLVYTLDTSTMVATAAFEATVAVSAVDPDGNVAAEPAYTLTTMPNGQYGVYNITPGVWQVAASFPGYHPQSVIVNIPELNQVRQDFFLVPENEPVPEPFPAPDPGQTAVVEGRVIQVSEDGATSGPLAGGTVYYMPVAFNYSAVKVYITKTDADGRYFLPEVRYDTYRVYVAPIGTHYKFYLVPVFEPHVIRDLTLVIWEPQPTPPPTPTPTPPPVEKGILKGVVTGDPGYPTFAPVYIAGAHIVLYPYNSTTNMDAGVPLPVAEAWTNESGQYEIAGLPYGYYKVFAEAEGWLPQNKFLAMNMPEKVMSFTLKTALQTPTPTPIQTVTPTPVPTGTPVPETITVGHGPGFDYQSITKALEAAVPGVTILVAPGEYTVQTGEVFPLLIKPGIRLMAMPTSTGSMHMPVIRGDGQSGIIRSVDLNRSGDNRTVIRGFMITGGSTTTDVGGGIYSENSNLSVESCVIAGNHALGGGGIIVIGGDVVIRESIIRENTSSGWGAGVRLQNQAKTLLANCLITSNTTSQNGGGVYAREGDHQMVNCTVANNTAISGGGVISSFGGTLHVTNSILWNNAGGDAVLGPTGTNILGIEYSCIGGGYPGTGNISDDPQLTPGWRLFQGSPCIDTADASVAPPVDLTGQPRPVDGDGDGVALPDMGCFEFRNMNPTPTPTPPPVGVIFGKVVQDVGNMTIVPPPIPGAIVRLFPVNWDNGIEAEYAGPAPIREVKTDENGFYKMGEVPYGSYYISADAAGYYPRKDSIKLLAPELEKDFYLIRKPWPTPTPTPAPAAGIYGVVSGTGENTDEIFPIAGALVEVLPLVDCTGGGRCIVPPVARAITDENGKYEINGIPAGPWEIRARAEGFIPNVVPVELHPEDMKEINFTLKPGTVPPGRGIIFGRVLGITQDSTVPAPIAARVDIFDPPVYGTDGEIQPGLADPVATAFTDRSGYYRVEGLQERDYIVRATAERYYPDHKKASILGEPVEVNFLLRHVPGPEPTPDGAVIRGRVVEWAPETREPEPIAGALVHIQRFRPEPIQDKATTDSAVIVKTDENGFYIAKSLDPGHYRVTARAEGYKPAFRHTHLHPNQIRVLHFALRPIQPTPTPVAGDGGLAGRVFAMVPARSDRPTSPIAGAMVSLFDIRAARDGSLRDADPIATAETDGEGRYEINPVPAGAYIVTAEAAGYLRSVRETRIIPDEVRELNFGLRPDIEPTPTPVPEPGSIEGEVVGLNPNGQAEPIPDCKVLLFDMRSFDRDNLPAPVAETVSDENGAFAFDDIESGRYIALARHEGYIPGAVPAPVFPGQVTSIVIRLMPRIEPTPTPEPRVGDLEGHVTQEGPDGLLPIPSARITAIRMDGAENEMIGNRVVRHAATDENGYYSIEDTFPGRYLVMAQAQGFEPAKAETDIIADEVAVQDFVLAAAEPPVPDTGAIVGRVAMILCITDDVTSCVRVPIEGAGILVMRILDNLEGSSSLLPVGRAVTDANGAYVVDNLPPGMYAVAASKEGFELAIAKARVRSFAETPVNFILLPDGSVDDPLETGVAYDNDFSNDGDGWKTGGAPGYYEMPETRRDGRAIHLRSRDNTNTFGFWNSPRDLLRLRAGIVYKAEFCIATDIEDPALVPTIRIRFNHQSEQQVDLVSLNSRAGAEISPTPEGRVYTHYFTPPSREILLPEDENDIYVSFDLINLAGEDEPEADVSLVWVKIEAVRAASLERGTLIAATDFTEGPQGWFEQYAEAFSCPEHITGIGALGLRATSNTDNFGGWASPLDLIEIEPDTMYAVVWDIFSDEINTSEMPGVRVRAADTLNRMLVEKGLFSNAEGDQSPHPLGIKTTLYYIPPQELAGDDLYLSWDIVNFNEGDSPDATVGLRSIKVFAIPMK